MLAAALWLAPARARAEAGAEDARAPAPPAAPEQSSPSHEDGLFGPLRIGALAGVGAPHPLSVEGLVTIDDRVALGVTYGVLPTLSSSGVDVRMNALDVGVRVFPLRDGLFFGVAAGHQKLDVTADVALPIVLASVAEEVSADTWYVAPKLGYLWTSRVGFTIGVEGGAQIPVASSFTNTIPTQLAVAQTATDVSHFIGKDVLPIVDVRAGWLF